MLSAPRLCKPSSALWRRATAKRRPWTGPRSSHGTAQVQEIVSPEEEKRLQRNRKAAERRKAKKDKEEELRAAAQGILGVSAKEFRQRMKEFLALLPGVKEPQLLSSLDPESLTELLKDPGSAAARLVQLATDNPAVDIPNILTTSPLILTTRHRTSFLLGDIEKPSCIALSPDGNTALTGDSGYIGSTLLHVWDLRTGTCTATLKGHKDQVVGVAVSSDGRRAVSASADGTLRVWDLATLKCVGKTPSRKANSKSCVAITPDGCQALSGGRYGDTLALWDLATCSQLATLLSDKPPAPAPPSASAPSLPASLQHRQYLAPGWGRSKQVQAVAISSDGRRALTAGSGLLLWDLPTRSITSTLLAETEYGSDIGCCAMSPDGRWAVVGIMDEVLLWDLQRYTCTELKGNTSWVTCVAVAPDGCYAVSGSSDGTLRVWDLQAGSCRAVLQAHESVESGVTAVAVSADGRRVVSGGYQLLRVWDLRAVLGQKPSCSVQRSWSEAGRKL